MNTLSPLTLYRQARASLSRFQRRFLKMDTKDDLDQQMRMVLRQAQKRFQMESVEPLKISIMGQTGIGKSSLINALFNFKRLKTNDTRPSTEKIEKVVFKKAGYELWFYDLPGIGESVKKDAQAMEQYRRMFVESDIILWAIHADSRSFTFDLDALHQIFESIDSANQAYLMSRITFVLTKVDLLTPSPWILSKTHHGALFVPQKGTTELLNRKQEYFQEVFLHPYKDALVSETYFDENTQFDLSIPQLRYDKTKGSVYYQGFLDIESLATLKKHYPKYKAVFERLHDNFQIIPCSSLFRFNLDLLMGVIINKLGTEAVSKLGPFYDSHILNIVPLSEARTFCNLVVFDEDSRRLLFDLAKSKFLKG